MREMSVYTHVARNERYQQLTGFLNDTQSHEKDRQELEKCQIALDSRTMEAESIVYRDVSVTLFCF